MSRKQRRKPPPRDIKVHRRTVPGASPGLVLPDPTQPQPVIHVIAYGANGVEEAEVQTADEASRDGGPAADDLDQRRRPGRRRRRSSGSASCSACTAWRWKTRSTSTSGPRSRTTARCCSSCCGWCTAGAGRQPLRHRADQHVRRAELAADVSGGASRRQLRPRAGPHPRAGRPHAQLGSDYLAYALIDAVDRQLLSRAGGLCRAAGRAGRAVLEPRSVRAIDQLHEVKADLLDPAAGDLAAPRRDGLSGPRGDDRGSPKPRGRISATATTTSCRSSSWSRPTAS